VEVKEVSNSCQTHPNQEAKYYCKKEGNFICEECRQGSHSTHGAISLEDFAHSLRTNAHSIEANLRNAQTSLSIQKSEAERELFQQTQEKIRKQEELSFHSSRLISDIKEKEKQKQLELDSLYNSLQGQSQIAKMQEALDEVNNALESLHLLQNRPNSSKLLSATKEFSSLLSRLSQLNSPPKNQPQINP